MKKLLLALALWPSLAFGQTLGPPSGSGGAFPPTGCATANGVIFNNATPCDSGFTYAGANGAVAIGGQVQGTAGTAAAPAYSFVGRTNLGMFSTNSTTLLIGAGSSGGFAQFSTTGTLSLGVTGVGNQLTMAATGAILFNAGILQIGGTTASFPELTFSGSTAKFRLADNSSDASITMASATLSGQLVVTAMTQTAAAQSGTVCYNSGTGAVTYDATVGCLTSTMNAKNNWQAFSTQQALDIVTRLEAGTFTYKPNLGLPDGPQIGLNAQQVALVDDRLVGYAPDGTLRGVRYQQASALYGLAIRALLNDLVSLRTRIEQLERR